MEFLVTVHSAFLLLEAFSVKLYNYIHAAMSWPNFRIHVDESQNHVRNHV